jgi:hypothetical protein
MPKMTRITYKCRCMIEEVSIDIPSRGRSVELPDWIERVVKPELGRDHATRSPLCAATAVEYLKLPIPEDGRRIGDSREALH